MSGTAQDIAHAGPEFNFLVQCYEEGFATKPAQGTLSIDSNFIKEMVTTLKKNVSIGDPRTSTKVAYRIFDGQKIAYPITGTGTTPPPTEPTPDAKVFSDAGAGPEPSSFDECNTRADCKAKYGDQATECVDSPSERNICQCGATRCSESGTQPASLTSPTQRVAPLALTACFCPMPSGSGCICQYGERHNKGGTPRARHRRWHMFSQPNLPQRLLM